MKKSLSVLWLPLIALFIVPLNASAAPVVVWNQGPIEALNFDFMATMGEPLPLELPGVDPLLVTGVEILTEGSEIAIATDSLDFYYYGDYEGGVILATYIAGVDEYGAYEYDILPITLESATLAEHYEIDAIPEDPNDLLTLPAPEEVDMYFDATLSIPGIGTFELKS